MTYITRRPALRASIAICNC